MDIIAIYVIVVFASHILHYMDTSVMALTSLRIAICLWHTSPLSGHKYTELIDKCMCVPVNARSWWHSSKYTPIPWNIGYIGIEVIRSINKFYITIQYNTPYNKVQNIPFWLPNSVCFILIEIHKTRFPNLLNIHI